MRALMRSMTPRSVVQTQGWVLPGDGPSVKSRWLVGLLWRVTRISFIEGVLLLLSVGAICAQSWALAILIAAV
jgi:hypothetical protein